MMSLRKLLGRLAVWLARRLRPEEFDALRAQALRQGRREAFSSLTLDLRYSVSVMGLLHGAGTHEVSQTWVKVFELLLRIEPTSLSKDEELAQLEALGVTPKRASLLVCWRDSRPETLVTLLLAILSGLPDEQAWRLAHKQ